MAPAFRQVGVAKAALLEALLAASLQSPQHLLRLIAVQYCGVIFPARHVTSRYLLLLARCLFIFSVVVCRRRIFSRHGLVPR